MQGEFEQVAERVFVYQFCYTRAQYTTFKLLAYRLGKSWRKFDKWKGHMFHITSKLLTPVLKFIKGRDDAESNLDSLQYIILGLTLQLPRPHLYSQGENKHPHGSELPGVRVGQWPWLRSGWPVTPIIIDYYSCILNSGVRKTTPIQCACNLTTIECDRRSPVTYYLK